MAELFVKVFPVSPQYVNGQPKFILEMDEYEFANLRWLMEVIYSGKHKEKHLNNGDWLGQIRHALVEGCKTNLEPNGGKL